ncbi:MAG: MarR family transcriptional regulator [Anaerolineales bacterium]|jgi:DNA-binding MarR family transcriptional regulator
METAELQTAAGELRSLTGRILKVARHDTEQRLSASKVGISALQYGILKILNNKNCTLSELSGLMGREPATLLPAVDTLETRGMLQRGRDPKDRRRTPLTITGQGMAVLERVPQVGENDLLLNALKGLGDQKVEQLIFLLREVALQVAQDKNKVGLKDHLETQKTRAGRV